MGDKSNTGGKKFGAGGLNGHIFAVAVENEGVVGAVVLARLQFGLRNRGLERDVPQARGGGLVGLAALNVAQERGLRNLLRLGSDGLISLLPIHGKAQVAPQRLELFFVFRGQLPAQLNKVAPRDRDLIGVLD